ncbi:aminoacyl-tRNA deacylase [bacterium]|nr:aminoacyl-tRNA deacylase [bacterium]
MSTRGVKFLQQHKIEFELIRYDHQIKGAEFAATSIGFPLSQTIKTLVVDLGDKRYCLALLPGDRQLSLKQLARVCGAKRAAMVDTATAERITGYLVGGISPFGTRQKLETVMETSLIDFDTVVINAGQRGSMLRLAPENIRTVLNCTVAEIAE